MARRAAPHRTPRVRRGRTGPTVVLMYHRVTEQRHDPLRLCVTPRHFDEHLRAIREVAEIVAPHRVLEPGAGPRVAVTFDDGYADNLEHAVPVLEAHDAPACIFVTDQFAPGAPEFWWDELDHLLLHGDAGAAFVELPLEHRTVRFDLRSEAGRVRTFSMLNNVFRDLDPEVRRRHLASLHDQVGRVPAVCAHHRRLDAAELRALAAGGLVELGGHTARHAALPLVDDAVAVTEVVQNRDSIAELTGRRPRLFAYPYGTYARRSAAAVRSADYELAFLARPGTIGSLTNPLAIPRLAAHDVPGDALLGELRRALALT